MAEKLPPPEGSKEDCARLAAELLALQKDKNNGRGVACIRDIVGFLRLGDLESARRISNHDLDKIRNYSEIAKWLIKNLYDREHPHPWQFNGKSEFDV